MEQKFNIYVMLYIRTYEDWRKSGGLHNPEDKETPSFSERNDIKHKEKFLLDYNYTYNWALKYHPNLEIDYDPEERDYYKTADHEIKNRIKLYMDIHKKCKNLNVIDIQRKICIKELKDINFDNVGLFWSFKKTSVGFVTIDIPYYEIIFHGYTKYNNINWENSLDNFIYYGYDESEVKLYPNSDITILSIDILHRNVKNNVYQFEYNNSSILNKSFPFTVKS